MTTIDQNWSKMLPFFSHFLVNFSQFFDLYKHIHGLKRSSIVSKFNFEAIEDLIKSWICLYRSKNWPKLVIIRSVMTRNDLIWPKMVQNGQKPPKKTEKSKKEFFEKIVFFEKNFFWILIFLPNFYFFGKFFFIFEKNSIYDSPGINFFSKFFFI